MNPILVRNAYTATTTIGDLLVGHKIFCHTLEDVVRPKTAAKVPCKTAIPSGRYKVELTFSNRFKRIMPLLIDVPGFEGVRIHGGNSSEDTEGCIIVAKNIIDERTVQGTMEREISEMLTYNPGPHFIEIIDTWPYVGLHE